MKTVHSLPIVVVCLMAMLCSHSLLAQSKRDSLSHLLEILPKNEKRVDVLNDLASLIVYAQPESTIQYSEEAVQLSKKLRYAEGQAVALNRLGGGYWAIGSLEKAFVHFNESRELSEQIRNEQLVAQNILSIGNIYTVMRNHNAALNYYRKALSYFQEADNFNRVAVVYNNFGKIFLEDGHYDSALFYLEKLKPLAQNHAPRALPIATFNQADVYFKLKQYDASKQILFECLELATVHSDQRATIRATQLLAEIAFQQGNVEDANRLSSIALGKALTTDVSDLLIVTYKTRARVMAELQQFDSAYVYKTEALRHQENLWDRDTESRVDFFEYAKQQSDLKVLTQENANKKLQITLVIVAAGLLIALILVGSFFRLQQHKHKTNVKLAKQNRAIAKQARELAKLNETKDKFFSIISHDVKAPVNQLVGLSQIMIAELEKGTYEDLRYMTDMMQKSAKNAQVLIEDLLTWARTQTESIPFEPRVFRLVEVIEKNLLLHKQMALQKGLQLKYSIAEEHVVFADEPMVNTVLRNLINNAIKFTAQGTITITITEHAPDKVKVTVADTGQGIRNELIPELFRIDSTYSTQGTQGEMGTGLGLVLCREFIERNGGEIWVESQYGQGSQFMFTLPKGTTLSTEKEVLKALA